MTASVTVLLEDMAEGVKEVRRTLEAEASEDGHVLVSWNWHAKPLGGPGSSMVTVTGTA